jgi:hypothetical protein
MENVKLTNLEISLLNDAISTIKNIQMSALRFDRGTLNDELYEQGEKLNATYESLRHKILISSLVQD